MSGIWDLYPIRFFDFYLVLLFVASLIRRIDWYRTVVGLVSSAFGRWPNLFKLVREQRAIFLTYQTLLPAGLALVLAIIQLTASRLIWPEAGRPPYGLTVRKLFETWWALPIVLPLGVAMFAVDVYFTAVVSKIDRQLLEKYFDQAEFWLKSRLANVVRIATFGLFHPRKIVATEVEKALLEVRRDLNRTLWWMVVQLSLRVSFGLSIWLTWAILMWRSTQAA